MASSGRSSDNIKIHPSTQQIVVVDPGGGAGGDSNREKKKQQQQLQRSLATRSFTFDYSYNSFVPPEHADYASQETVWRDLGESVLESAWAGFNVSLFAYGQTGSGKTYSMLGYGEDRGIIPRAGEVMFERIHASSDAEDVKYKVEVSMLEIYCEVVRDLFNPSSGSLKVRDHPNIGAYAEGLTRSAVSSYSQIEQLMDAGVQARTTAATQMNATSSRSHTIFQIVFTQTRIDQETEKATDRVSCINLIDLAGSERANSAGTKGDRLREGAAINQSLSALGNCISTLAENAKFAAAAGASSKQQGGGGTGGLGLGASMGLSLDVNGGGGGGGGGRRKKIVPYRNSKLTHLLKDSLGGNARTIMVAAISPASINYNETLSTLRYADRAKQIKNAAIVNDDPNQRVITQLKKELTDMRNRMREMQAMGAPPAAATAASVAQSEDTQRQMKELMAKEVARSQALLQEREKKWEDRLKETERLAAKQRADLQSIGLGCDAAEVGHKAAAIPHLINLNEDAAMNEKLRYFLDPGAITRIGRRDGNSSAVRQDIILGGVGIQAEHCAIHNSGEKEKDAAAGEKSDDVSAAFSKAAGVAEAAPPPDAPVEGTLTLVLRDMDNAKCFVNGRPLHDTGNEYDDLDDDEKIGGEADSGGGEASANRAITRSAGTVTCNLRHNDRVVLGNNNIFRVVHPAERASALRAKADSWLNDEEAGDNDSGTGGEGETAANKAEGGDSRFDWHFAMNELSARQMAALERHLSAQREAALKEKEALAAQVRVMETVISEERSKAKQDAEKRADEFRRLAVEREEQMREKEQSLERALEDARSKGDREEREAMERLRAARENLDLERDEAERKFQAEQEGLVKRQQELESVLHRQIADAERLAVAKENEQRQQLLLAEQLSKVLPLCNEANAMSEEMGIGAKFSIKLMPGIEPAVRTAPLEGTAEAIAEAMATQVHIQVKFADDDAASGSAHYSTAVWDDDKFTNRLYLMREVYQEFVEGGRTLDDIFATPEDDPWYDPPDDQLIGSSWVYLEPLSFLLDIDDSFPVLSSAGSREGDLRLRISVSESGGSLKKRQGGGSIHERPDSLSQLDGRPVDLHVQLRSAHGLPQSLSHNVHVRFRVYDDDSARFTRRCGPGVTGGYSSTRAKKSPAGGGLLPSGLAAGGAGGGTLRDPLFNHRETVRLTVDSAFMNYVSTRTIEFQVWGRGGDSAAIGQTNPVTPHQGTAASPLSRRLHKQGSLSKSAQSVDLGSLAGASQDGQTRGLLSKPMHADSKEDGSEATARPEAAEEKGKGGNENEAVPAGTKDDGDDDGTSSGAEMDSDSKKTALGEREAALEAREREAQAKEGRLAKLEKDNADLMKQMQDMKAMMEAAGAGAAGNTESGSKVCSIM